jgi:hypothetical protein
LGTETKIDHQHSHRPLQEKTQVRSCHLLKLERQDFQRLLTNESKDAPQIEALEELKVIPECNPRAGSMRKSRGQIIPLRKTDIRRVNKIGNNQM